MATSGRGSGVVGDNVQIAVEANHHLIFNGTRPTNQRNVRTHHNSPMWPTRSRRRWARRASAVADRGYFNSEEILACEEAGITVTLPKPMTSNAKAERMLR